MPARKLWELIGQELLLHEVGHLQFLRDALPLRLRPLQSLGHLGRICPPSSYRLSQQDEGPEESGVLHHVIDNAQQWFRDRSTSGR